MTVNEKMYALGSKRSEIRELFEYGKSMKARIGEDKVYDFSLGNPSTPPPSIVTEKMKELLENEEPCSLHGYSSAQGDAGVREAIANDLATRCGAEISKDKIYMTCGAAASLCITIRSLVISDKSEFLTQAPFFPEYKVFTESMGGAFTVVPADTSTFELNIEGFEKAINENTQGIIINSPNNPSGVIYSEASLKALSELVDGVDIIPYSSLNGEGKNDVWNRIGAAIADN